MTIKLTVATVGDMSSEEWTFDNVEDAVKFWKGINTICAKVVPTENTPTTVENSERDFWPDLEKAIKTAQKNSNATYASLRIAEEDNRQLSEDVKIDWGGIPERFEWFAIDEDGSAYFFEYKPKRGCGMWDDFTGEIRAASDFSHVYWSKGIDWQKSLRKRNNQVNTLDQLTTLVK